MADFQSFYQLGLQHVLHFSGYDHIIFVIALCVRYQADDWKHLLILITAFTVGHAMALFLAVFSLFGVDNARADFLIPAIILVTAVLQIFGRSTSEGFSVKNYLLAIAFALVHGLYMAGDMGLTTGAIELAQLFAFNVGLEVGQLIIIAVLMVAGFLFVSLFGISRRDWKMVLSSAVAGIALVLVIESGYL